MTQLSDEQIDQLSGAKLGITVAEKLGYTNVIESKSRQGRLFGIAPGETDGRESLPEYHNDLSGRIGFTNTTNHNGRTDQ